MMSVPTVLTVALFAMFYPPNAIANAEICAFVSDLEKTSKFVRILVALALPKSDGLYGRTTASVVLRANKIGLLYPVVGSVAVKSPALVVETK